MYPTFVFIGLLVFILVFWGFSALPVVTESGTGAEAIARGVRSLDEMVADAMRSDDTMLEALANNERELGLVHEFESALHANVKHALSAGGWSWIGDRDRFCVRLNRGSSRMDVVHVPSRNGEPDHWLVRAHLPTAVRERRCKASHLGHSLLVCVGWLAKPAVDVAA